MSSACDTVRRGFFKGTERKIHAINYAVAESVGTARVPFYRTHFPDAYLEINPQWTGVFFFDDLEPEKTP